MTPGATPEPAKSPAPASANGPLPGAGAALALLLAINLFNSIDRQVLSAGRPTLQLDADIFSPTDPYLKTKLGSLTTAFLVTYMLISPVFGWLGDRRSRWGIVGVGVILWSLASGGSGLATSFLVLLLTRCLVGIGEAAYGPVAPSMLSDLYPVRERGRVLAMFYLAIPVGSALGFVVGGQVADTSLGWRGAFLVVVLPGLLLGTVCFLMREPPREKELAPHGWRDYGRILRQVLRIRSYFFNTAAMTATTFVLGGVAAWAPFYIFEREARFVLDAPALTKLADQKLSNGEPVVPAEVRAKLAPLAGPEVLTYDELLGRISGVLTKDELANYRSWIFDAAPAPGSLTTGKIGLIFGAIVVVSGLGATLLGGWAGDKLRNRFPGSYFLVSGGAALLSFPFFLAMLYVPFPYAWGMIFLAVFGLFFNTGPANTILANVTHPSVRATGFALNILIIHLLGDAISPPLIGLVADNWSLHAALVGVSFLILVGGVLWLLGARHLQRDTELAPTRFLH